ncbi:hypothetical protein B0H13DRAFT_2080921 [Mycena leptocephala]|nr:hypothetical protein B0H13DRAFT_2080921 [Mycena leptocephala]
MEAILALSHWPFRLLLLVLLPLEPDRPSPPSRRLFPPYAPESPSCCLVPPYAPESPSLPTLLFPLELPALFLPAMTVGS